MATRGHTPEWRCEVARLLPRPTCGGAPSPPLTSVLPTLIPVAERVRQGGGVEILPPSLCQPLSLTSPSPGGSECASCASEKNKKLSEIRENYPPSLCAKFRNFSTRSGPAVSAPARGRRQNRHRRANWHLSCPPTRVAPRRIAPPCRPAPSLFPVAPHLAGSGATCGKWRKEGGRTAPGPRRGGAALLESGGRARIFLPIFTAPWPRSPIFTMAIWRRRCLAPTREAPPLPLRAAGAAGHWC